MDLETFFTLLAGTGLSALGERSRNKRQEDLSHQMTAYKLGKSRESTAAIEQYLASLQPAARQVENPVLKKEIEDSLRQSIATTQEYQTPENFAGKVSERYGTARARDQAAVDQRISRAIDQFGTLNVPAERAMRDRVRFNTAAVDVNQANRAAGNVGAAYGQAMEMAQPNRFLSFAGQILRGLGTATKPQPKKTPTPAPIAELE